MNIFFGNDELSFSYIVFNFSNPWEAQEKKNNRKELSKSQLISFYWKTKAIILRSGANAKYTFDVEIWPPNLCSLWCGIYEKEVGPKSQPIFALFASSVVVICQSVDHCKAIWNMQTDNI